MEPIKLLWLQLGIQYWCKEAQDPTWQPLDGPKVTDLLCTDVVDLSLLKGL